MTSREPVMAKTKIASEKLLMNSMTTTGQPYKTPEQLSVDISKRVRQEKEETTELRAELTEKLLTKCLEPPKKQSTA